MVSFWPFRGDDTSTANFEKTLSALTQKLQKANERDTLLRTRSRRLKALWTLYTSFIYILYSLILVLVTGYQRWGAPEYTAVAGGPVVVYLVRRALSAYYDYRLSTNRAYTKSVTAQRKQAIDKFKSATKYDSTQQLLEKYGAEQPRETKPGNTKKKTAAASPSNDDDEQQKPQEPPKRQPTRTNLPPPPTANIQRPAPSPPMHIQPPPPAGAAPPATPVPATPASPDASFAPSAQYAAPPAPPQWYDRLLDVLLGDDETKPINRLALICGHCRLVNGQAPPGVRRLADVGRWRCAACKQMNGEDGGSAAEEEVQKLMEEVGAPAGGGGVADALVPTAEEDDAAEEVASPTPARATRSQTARAGADDS